ncbi:hypothetical protein HPB51_026632 [Rhipicephalus microplus]|uniref:BHLH domain-containing protein n=1 Tax=Rhipicephalus microplus TaxID=6941 RepID=A0A9J6D2L5_RHIMP|nr:hypothetical protein HPB51_026632 [Rhipicephalus microplus]
MLAVRSNSTIRNVTTSRWHQSVAPDFPPKCLRRFTRTSVRTKSRASPRHHGAKASSASRSLRHLAAFEQRLVRTAACEAPPRLKPRPLQRNAANARERARMRVLSRAFSRLKTSLPWVPEDTKLSKLDTLRLAAGYIAHLRRVLIDDDEASSSSPASAAEDAACGSPRSLHPLALWVCLMC